MDRLKKPIVLLYVVVIFLMVVGLSYAYDMASIVMNVETGQFGIDESVYGDTVFDSSNLNMVPILDSEVETREDNVIKIDFNVKGAENNPEDKPVIYDIALVDLRIDCNILNTDLLKWRLYKNDELLYESNFSTSVDTVTNGRYLLTQIQQDLITYETISPRSYDSYTFYIWLSDVCQEDDISNCQVTEEMLAAQQSVIGKNISGKVEVELYTESKKAHVKNPLPVGNDSCARSIFAYFMNASDLNSDSIEIFTGEEYGNLPTPAKEGHTFDGWYLEETYENLVTEDTVVESDTSVSLYAKWSEADTSDTTAPEVALVSSSNLRSIKQTATLKCVDEVGVTGYYFGTSEPTSSSTYTTVTPTTSMSIDKNVTAAGTYYLACKDAVGNVSSTVSKVYNSYTVNIMLLKVTGTAGTYTTSNYAQDSTNTYILPYGAELNLDNLKVAPIGAGAEQFKGISIGSPSTTAATLINEETTKLVINMMYSIWFDRLEYMVSGSVSSGSGSVVLANQRGETITTSSSMSEISVRYGETITATATPSSGYVFSGWEGLVSGTTTPVTVTPNTNGEIKAGFGSAAAPVATLTSTSNLKTTSQTATLGCTGTGGVVSYYFGTTSPTDSSTYTSITSTTNMSLTQSITSAGTYYLACKNSGGSVSNVASITYNSYTVNNMLVTGAGTAGTYTTSNYAQASTNTYIAPSGTSLTLASVYTIPTNATSSTFKGVSTGAASTTAATVSTTAPTLNSNTTYSMWFDRTTYAVSFNANGGSGAPSAQLKKKGADLTLSLVQPTRTGYTFLGWGTAADATEAVYQAGGTYSSDAAITLYALWRINKVYVRYNMNDGTWGGSSNTYYSYNSSDFITRSDNPYGDVTRIDGFNYGATGVNLHDWNSSSYINITRTNYKAVTGAQWKTSDGSKTFSHDAGVYNASDLCNASNGDCTIDLYVNWVQANYSVVKDSKTHYYNTLANAINGAVAGNTITLLRSITDTSTVTFDKNLTFTTNGLTLTRTAIMTVNSGVTLTKSGSGTISNTGSGTAGTVFVVNGNLTASAGTIKSSTTNVIWNNGTGTVTISGATITNGTATNSTSASCIINGQGGTISVTSGTVTGGINNYRTGSVKVSGGTITSTSTYMVNNSSSGTVTISGGTIGTTSSTIQAVRNSSTGSTTITGGTIQCGAVTCVQNAGTGTLYFNAGKITSGGTAMYNSSTGLMRAGVSSNTSTATISTTGTGGSYYCGNSSSGSQARCWVYAGATITNTSGPAVTNYSGDYRQYTGSTVKTTSTSTVGAIYNRGSTYTTGTISDTTYYYGRVYVRNGVVSGVKNGIYSNVAHSSAVYIGNKADTIFTTWSTSPSNTANGPTIIGTSSSEGRGVYLSANESQFQYGVILANGVAGGNYKSIYALCSDVTTPRSGYYTKELTGSYADGYEVYYLDTTPNSYC